MNHKRVDLGEEMKDLAQDLGEITRAELRDLLAWVPDRWLRAMADKEVGEEQVQAWLLETRDRLQRMTEALSEEERAAFERVRAAAFPHGAAYPDYHARAWLSEYLWDEHLRYPHILTPQQWLERKR